MQDLRVFLAAARREACRMPELQEQIVEEGPRKERGESMNDVEDQILANQIAIMRILRMKAPATFFVGMHDYQQELSDRIKETEDLIQCHEEPA